MKMTYKNPINVKVVRIFSDPNTLFAMQLCVGSEQFLHQKPGNFQYQPMSEGASPHFATN